ncbi:hypothetical protein C8R43DRAFT_567593 [Mycena crocata]|nr:hypothetical protein C8R43DRAFT_567593 [Mycena crocata]
MVRPATVVRFRRDSANFVQRRNRAPRKSHSRNPGRRDGFHWNADAFLCPGTVDGFHDVRNTMAANAQEEAERSLLDTEQHWVPDGGGVCGTSVQEVSILDIARHAKPKGVAKDFEILEAPRRIIALDENTFSEGPSRKFLVDDEESEWENVDDFHLGGESYHSEGNDADYLFARRLQDEEDAVYEHAQRESRGISEAQRKAYADVARDNIVATEG